jgi:hypothetical protein
LGKTGFSQIEKEERMRTSAMRWVYLLAVLALVMFPLACGGSGSSSLNYEGEEGMGSLPDGGTASEYLTKGYSAFDLVSVLAATQANTGGIPLTLSADVQPQVITTQIVQQRIFGAEDGYFDVDLVWNTLTDYFSGTVIFNEYSDMPGQFIDGSADAEGYGINMEGPPDITTLTFSNLSISNWGMEWQASGEMTVDNGWEAEELSVAPLAVVPDSVVTIPSMVLKDQAGDTYKIEDAWIGVVGGETTHAIFINATEASGLDGAKFYHPDYGYLYVRSMSGLLINNDTGIPMDGYMEIWDDADQYAWLDFVSNGATHWFVWLDGGNLYLDYGTSGEPDDTLYATGIFSSGVFTLSPPD